MFAGSGCECHKPQGVLPSWQQHGAGPKQMESCPASEREPRPAAAQSPSHTSKRVDRKHKSTAAMQIKAEHRNISQTATPKVMRGQNLGAHSFSL